MKRSSVLLCALVLLAAGNAFGRDDFDEVVHQIESRYHFHHNYGFLMGFASLMVNVSHVGGVKGMKAAIFEDQNFRGAQSDTEFDEVVRGVLKSGWRPLIQVFSRRTGERTYIYAQTMGKDLKVLLVNVEPSEAVVMELKVNPDKLEAFINEHTKPHRQTEQNPASPRRHGGPEKDMENELGKLAQTLCLL